MRIAYLDCVGGISGDMFVGALLDAGWSEEAFRASVAWLSDEIADLRIETREQHALAGKGICVTPTAQEAHDHDHDHGHHHHHPVRFRGLPEVLTCLEATPLSPPVREQAGAVFRRLAEAEARAHGKPIEKVHFHEVGAVDAMVDIVTTIQGLTDLGIEELYVSRIPVGRGTIEAAHGMIPLPAPATAYLLQGVPIRWTEADGERTTPTGAALVTTLGRWDPCPAMNLEMVGTGVGSRTLADAPNLARLFIGEESTGSEHGSMTDRPTWGWSDASRSSVPGSWGQVRVLSAQIDDASGEELADWSGRLLGAGALDVTLTPVTMKKGRPGILLEVFCRPSEEQALASMILHASSTLGLRCRTEWRRELERKEGEVVTRYGTVRVKLALRANGWVGKPEYESCRASAERAQVPWRVIWRAALAALEEASTDGE